MESREEKAFGGGNGAPQPIDKSKQKIMAAIVGGVGVLVILVVVISNMSGPPKRHPKATKMSAQAAIDSLKNRKAAPEQKFEEQYTHANQGGQPGAEIDPTAQPALGPNGAMVQPQGRQVRPTMGNDDNNPMNDEEGPGMSTRTHVRPHIMNSGLAEPINTAPYQYTPPNDMKQRLDPQYQAIVTHFKGASQEAAWKMDDAALTAAMKSQDQLAQVEKPLKDLYEGATAKGQFNNILVPAGSRILAVTEQEVNSDHPGLFTAKVVRPYELQGCKMVLQGGPNSKDRIPATVLKIINETTGKEFTVNGQVEMQYPGMDGRVWNNWYKRLGPELINTAIGGVALAATINSASGGTRINTADAIAGPIVQQSVTGLQNEISRMGGDVPNTIIVPAGTQFAVLLQAAIVTQ